MILNPKPYQHEALKYVLERPRAGLFMDMGLGKTAVSLAAISELMRAGHVSKTLIVAPIRVLENGIRQAGSDPRRDGWAGAY